MSLRRSGILVHPSSLYSPYGIGDLGEGAYRFIDFLEKGKQTLWQILPLSHVGYGNSPYSSYSAFACNPWLISPDKLANDGLLSNEDLRNIPYFKPDRVEFEKVMDYKVKLFKKAFQMFNMYADKKPFRKFCEENSFWLDDYTLYISIKNHLINERKTGGILRDLMSFASRAKSYLKDHEILDQFYGAAFVSFPDELLDPTEEVKAKWRAKLLEDIEYYSFLQYEFYKQWSQLKKYANDKGIEIIGDMPIFIAADSADAWLNRELFHYNSEGFPEKIAVFPLIISPKPVSFGEILSTDGKNTIKPAMTGGQRE